MAEYIELSQATTLFGDVDARFDTVEGKIPSNASSSNKLATASDITSITEKIPVNASSSNKLVTEADIAAAYHAAGTKTVAELLSSLLVAANEGNVYNMTDAGTTTADFIEGAGKPIRIGDNVGVCKVGNDYKFDLLSGFIDTSNFVEKSSTSGLLKNDGTVDTTSYVETVSGKGLSTNDYTNNDKTALQTTIPLEITQLQGSLLNKVDKEVGKGLSTNDYDATAKGKVDGMDASIAASQNGSTALTKATVGWTGKNILSFDKLRDTRTSWDVVYTNNGDGTITRVGTSTGDSNTDTTVQLVLPNDKSYIASIEGATTGIRVSGIKSGNEELIASSEGTEATFTTSSMYSAYVLQARTLNAHTYNEVLKPMLRPASITDSTFEPYHESVEEVIGDMRAEQRVLGAKNLLKYPYANVSETREGVVRVVNDNGTVSLNDTATANSSFSFVERSAQKYNLRKGRYIVSSNIKSGSYSGEVKHTFRIIKEGAGIILAEENLNTEAVVELDGDYYFGYQITIPSGASFTDCVVQPMIRIATDTDDTYVPYAMTNRELTEIKESEFTNIPSGATVVVSEMGNHIIKVGKVVVATLSLNSLTANAWSNICTVPEGFRPKYEVRPLVYSDGSVKRGKIGTNGNLQCANSITEDIAVYATWITT